MKNKPVTYKQMNKALTDCLHNLSMLAGDKVDNGSTWQDVCGQAEDKLCRLAGLLAQARNGNHEAFICFPSPTDCLEQADEINSTTKG